MQTKVEPQPRAQTRPAPPVVIQARLPHGDGLASLLRNVPLFAEFTPTELQLLVRRAELRTYPKGAVVLNQGDRTDSLYVVVSGTAKAYLTSERGKELTLALQTPCDYFGELALLDAAPRSASVLALESMELLVVSRHDVADYLAANPQFAIRVIGELTQRVRALTEKARILGLQDAYGRIVSTLRHMAVPTGSGWVIEQHLTHQDLANMVGTSRESVTRVLKDLRIRGYTSIREQRIVLQRPLPKQYLARARGRNLRSSKRPNVP